MSLYPGKPRRVEVDGREKHVLDDIAMANSMAKMMEEEMSYVYKEVKNTTTFPVEGREDRRILFVSISRGILRYIDEHQEAANQKAIQVTIDNASISSAFGSSVHNHGATIDVNVNMNSHDAH